MTVPDDFPRECAGLAGAQPKVGVRLDDGLYVSDRRARYDVCEDLAQQLAAYCTRKATENPAWTLTFNLERASRGVVSKIANRRWDLSDPEQRWLMKRVRVILEGQLEEHAPGVESAKSAPRR